MATAIRSQAQSLTLCHFSKSELLADRILPACPFSLSSTQAKKCPCKKRLYHVPPADLRVLSCTYPELWNGKPIKDPERFRAALLNRLNRETRGTNEMTTTTAERPANTVTSSDGDGIWGGIRIPVIGITGEKFSGKSVFASIIDPERTLYVDCEKSTETYNFPYKRRFDLYTALDRRLKGKVPTSKDSFLCVKEEVIESIEPGEFTVLAFDPWNDLEAGLADYVYDNADQFGKTKAQYDRGGGLLWGDVKSYMKLMLGSLTSKVETVVFINHMGYVWKGAAPTEKRKAKGKETIYELASLYLELQRKTEIKPDGKVVTPKVPSAAVLKSRLAHHRFADGEMEIIPILPPRLPEASPKAIRDYIAHPPTWDKLKKGEQAQPEEQMSEDDKLRLRAEIAQSEKEAEELKMSRIERMAAAAKEQAAMRANQQKLADTIQPQTTTAAAAAAPASGASDAEQPPNLHQTIAEQFQTLGLTSDQISKVLSKRGVTRVEDLNPAQAEELRQNLWDRITKLQMQSDLNGKK